MKKIIISGVAVLAIAAAATLNVNLNKRSNDLSGISLANVEALAENEGNGGTTYQGTSADCSNTTVVETYTAGPGWSYEASSKVWFFQGKVTNTVPSDYQKTTSTTTSKWSGCKPQGSTSCTAPSC